MFDQSKSIGCDCAKQLQQNGERTRVASASLMDCCAYLREWNVGQEWIEAQKQQSAIGTNTLDRSNMFPLSSPTCLRVEWIVWPW